MEIDYIYSRGYFVSIRDKINISDKFIAETLCIPYEEYEDLLINDGCTGLAVLNPDVPQEVQFDEHKLLIVYGDELREFENVLRQRTVGCNEQIRFITEAEHVHSSSDTYAGQFDELKTRLGMDCEYSRD